MIHDLIAAHQAAVIADEALFDDDGKALEGCDTAASEKIEREAFIRLVRAPCACGDDVQAKVEYLINGTIGIRSSLIDYLIEHSDGDTNLVGALLGSLITQERKWPGRGGNLSGPWFHQPREGYENERE